MEINWATVGWIGGLLFVYLFGLFEGRGQGYKRRKAEEAKEDKERQPAPATPAAPITVDDPGILRIKNENGALTLDLDGTRMDTNSLSPDHRKRLIELLTLIRPWLEGKAAAATSMTSPSSRINTTQSAPVPAATPISQPAPQNQPPAPKISSSAIDDRPVAPANSIVGQIDTILQAHLAGTPLAERGIFLAQSSEGGVMVYVGLQKYMGVDEVPDPEIKSVIRAAISEWEKKYTPGL